MFRFCFHITETKGFTLLMPKMPFSRKRFVGCTRTVKISVACAACCRAFSIICLSLGWLVLFAASQSIFAQEPINFTPVFVNPDNRDTGLAIWGDADGDGDLDLAFGHDGFPNQVYENVDGQLRFAPEQSLGWESAPTDETGTWGLAWGDMDGDGDLDLAVANASDDEPNQIFANDGDGIFTLAWREPMAVDGTFTESFNVAWGDMDGDGDLDLAFANAFSPNQVFRNDGRVDSELAINADDDCTGNEDLGIANSGNEESATHTHAFTLCWESGNAFDSHVTMWGDLNGDGNLDLVFGNVGQKNTVYENFGRGNFKLVWQSPDALHTWGMDLGDVNGDGHLDLVFGNGQFDESGDWPELNELYFNSGDDNFTFMQDDVWQGDWLDAKVTKSVALGDADGDGDLDLAVGNVAGAANQVFLNHNGTFSDSPDWTSDEDTMETFRVTWGDMDGDGDLDLAFANAEATNTVNQVYRNDSLLPLTPVATRPAPRHSSLALGDADGDGDLDLIVAGIGARAETLTDTLVTTQSLSSRFYTNVGDGTFVPGPILPQSEHNVRAVAWGDMDGDGDLDFAFANAGAEVAEIQGERWLPYEVIVGASNQVFANQGDNTFKLVWTSPTQYLSKSVVWGDVNGDGHLDLLFGNTQRDLVDPDPHDVTDIPLGAENRVFINDGNGNFAPRCADTDDACHEFAVDCTTVDECIARSIPCDVDDDTLTDCQQIALQLDTEVLALSDVDDDGDLDLAVGNRGEQGEPNQLFVNDGSGRFTLAWLSPDLKPTTALAWGDMDGDGDLDLVAGNADDLDVVYRNDGQAGFAFVTLDTATHTTTGVAWTDLDGDDDLDIVAANGWGAKDVLYRNDGAGTFTPEPLNAAQDWTTALALGDTDRDGDTDLITASLFAFPFSSVRSEITFYRNGRQGQDRQLNNGPTIRVSRPISSPAASGYVPGQLVDDIQIPFSFTVNDPDGDAISEVVAFYSLNGGGKWFPAHPTAETQTTNLAAGQTYIFVWDTFKSGFFGQSNNVVIRMVARTQPTSTVPVNTFSYANRAVGHFQRGEASAVTYPFRARGNQVRVVDEQGAPLAGAFVFRLPVREVQGAQPMASVNGEPFVTDVQGYLGGRGAIAIGDRLVALHYITSTLAYDLYHTSAAPREDGLDFYEVRDGGVQTLTVPLMGSDVNPLVLYHLSVALEWDPRNDDLFLSGLDNAFQRASDILFDVTDGQVALGEVAVFINKENWVSSDIVIYADGSLRPRASMGGVTLEPLDDVITVQEVITQEVQTAAGIQLVPQAITRTVVISDAYITGQIRMGPVWDPFGKNKAELTEDWWLALAHELAHYLFFLPDNYLGVADGLLRQIDCPQSFMTNNYDEGYREFLTVDLWVKDPHLQPAIGCC